MQKFDHSNELEVSIVIPLYNRAALIEQCIDCLPKSSEWEVIIVDDGSTDGSAAAARAAISRHAAKDRMKVVEQENAGPGQARNTGAKLASGKWLAFLDSDDYWAPQTSGDILEATSKNDDAVLLFLQTVDFSAEEGAPEPAAEAVRLARHDRFLSAVKNNPGIRFAGCNFVIRREIFSQLGGFTEATSCSEDSDLFLRADSLGPVICICGPWRVAHRVGGGDALTANVPQVIKGFQYLCSQDANGNYGKLDSLRDNFLSKSAAFTIRVAFANGYPVKAYQLLATNLGMIYRGDARSRIWRLALTPVLSVIRPSSFPMRWK